MEKAKSTMVRLDDALLQALIWSGTVLDMLAPLARQGILSEHVYHVALRAHNVIYALKEVVAEVNRENKGGERTDDDLPC